MTAILECEGLVKTYGGLRAVNQVSFQVAAGEIYAIIGPNGAGKTTLFDLVSGLIPPTAGAVRFDGQEIQGFSPDKICRLGLMRSFQSTVSFATQTVLTNVLVGAMYGRTIRHRLTMRFNSAAIEAALASLDRCGLLDKQGVKTDLLSVFDKKRLMLATALASHCRLLLLDEPVGGLNAGEREAYLGLIRALNEEDGVTVLMVEHVMQAVRALADTAMVLHHGERLLEGTPSEVLADQQVLDVYLGTKSGHGDRPPPDAAERSEPNRA